MHMKGLSPWRSTKQRKQLSGVKDHLLVSSMTSQTVFITAVIAVVVTLAISWVGLLILNSLLILPAASARNVAKNLRQYHLFSVLFALVAGVGGLIISYYVGASAGAAISLVLAGIFIISFLLRKVRC